MLQKSRGRPTSTEKVSQCGFTASALPRIVQLTPAQHRFSGSALLNLPHEIRQLIYTFMLELSSGEHLNFLCVSKQAFMEAQGVYSQRPLTCCSQDDFISVSSTMTTSALSKVRHLSLRLEDHRSAQMQKFLSMVVAGAKLSWHDTPYYATSESIKERLSHMDGIEILELLPPEKDSRQPPARFVNAILTNIGYALPNLRSLTIGFEHCSLRDLRRMNSLQRLVLTGFSADKPQRAAKLLSKLPNLIELKIRSNRYRHTIIRSKLAQFSHSIITHHLFEQIRPLERLEITEFVEDSNDGHTSLTVETVSAIKQFHGPTLRKLFLTSNIAPSDSVVELLKSIQMDMTNPRHIKLDFPGFRIRES